MLPTWGFDGSSTGQAPGDSSDCALRPVFYVEDPVRKEDPVTISSGGIVVTTAPKHYLVLCEVYNADGTPHVTNTRAKLRDLIDIPLNADAEQGSPQAEKLACWFGLEQEGSVLLQGEARNLVSQFTTEFPFLPDKPAVRLDLECLGR